MISKNEIESILKIAKNAPSGDNTQPWRIAFVENGIDIYNDPTKTNPIFDRDQYGAYVGHGCFIKNIQEVAKEKGFFVNISYFPGEKSNHVAHLDFSKGKGSSLGAFVPERKTNRNHYKNQLLSKEEKDLFENENLILFDTEKEILAEYLSKGEKIVFETKELQDLIYESLTWTKKEEAKKKEGLFVETLELTPPQKVILKLAENRAILNVLNSIGFAKLISKSNEETYMHSSAIGFIVGERSPKSYVKAGELLEETWLKAISLGMSLQIINGFVFMSQDIEGVKENTSISEENISLLKEGNSFLRERLRLEGGQYILSAFRIGYPKKQASAESTKHEIEELLHRND